MAETARRRVVIETITNPVYTPGQGGTVFFSSKVPNVEEATVVQVRPSDGAPIAGTVITAYVRDVGLVVGTVDGTPPTPNKIRLVIQSVGQDASGTITTVTEGVPPVTGTTSGTIPVSIDLLIRGL